MIIRQIADTEAEERKLFEEEVTQELMPPYQGLKYQGLK
jgi:hypothetical protein